MNKKNKRRRRNKASKKRNNRKKDHWQDPLIRNAKYTPEPPVSYLLTMGDLEGSRGLTCAYDSFSFDITHIPSLVLLIRDFSLYYKYDPSQTYYYAPYHAIRVLIVLVEQITKMDENSPNGNIFPKNNRKCITLLEPIVPLLGLFNLNSLEKISREIVRLFTRAGVSCVTYLFDFLKRKKKNSETANLLVIETIGNIGSKYIEREKVRKDIINILGKLIDQPRKEGAKFNSFIINSLLKIRAVETYSAIRHCYALDVVDERISGDLNDVIEILGVIPDKNDRLIKRCSNCNGLMQRRNLPRVEESDAICENGINCLQNPTRNEIRNLKKKNQKIEMKKRKRNNDKKMDEIFSYDSSDSEKIESGFDHRKKSIKEKLQNLKIDDKIKREQSEKQLQESYKLLQTKENEVSERMIKFANLLQERFTTITKKKTIKRQVLHKCEACGKMETKEKEFFLCGDCLKYHRYIYYCSKNCQLRDWMIHKEQCGIKKSHTLGVSRKTFNFAYDPEKIK
ncbi:zinc finger mynd-type tetratricopeptide-like helical domain protein-related [Anaeramoeba flamelloides]|uniref:Zinc finger mynd-type tetratricopeptide-like helical domain protein-related n=1 Tax=Anaeramoeba flamelloides TaxID=1746091 RepID=A0AAV7YR22_9EUKA|nr:zinc finger mynd-type tetratricopeptide-like helical domain protein-related [Anaeramoeba flamelloides]